MVFHLTIVLFPRAGLAGFIFYSFADKVIEA